MAFIHLNLAYPQLAEMLQTEANKQKIEIRGHEIEIKLLQISCLNSRLIINGAIASTWDASFSFSTIPSFDLDSNKIKLADIILDLNAKNLIFKGILKLAKGNIKSRLEKILAQPIDQHLVVLRKKIDEEMSKAPLPYEMALLSDTKDVRIKELFAGEEALHLKAEVDLNLEIKYKE